MSMSMPTILTKIMRNIHEGTPSIYKSNNRTQYKKIIDSILIISECLDKNLSELHALFSMRIKKANSPSIFEYFLKSNNKSNNITKTSDLKIQGKFNFLQSTILKDKLKNYESIYQLMYEIKNDITKKLPISLYSNNEKLTNILYREPLQSITIKNNLNRYKKEAFPPYTKILENIQSCLKKYIPLQSGLKIEINSTKINKFKEVYTNDIGQKIGILNDLITKELHILKKNIVGGTKLIKKPKKILKKPKKIIKKTEKSLKISKK